MRPSVIVGLLSLLAALVLYSLGSWGAFRSKSISRRHVTLLWAGFAFDVLATVSMASAIGGLDLSETGWLHTVLAIAVMLGMLVLAILGTNAVRSDSGTARASVARWALAPWALWLVVFVWGVLSRAPGRS